MLLRALKVYELARVDFAEAYLLAQAEATDIAEILSFRPFDRQDQDRHRREP